MPNIEMRREYAPIKCVQTTLLKFDPSLLEPQERGLGRVVENSTKSKVDLRYHIENRDLSNIYIVEIRCLDCNQLLVNNGINKRLVILDKGLGKFRLNIHRKRCTKCGEIRPDYSDLAPKYGNFHENIKRIARQMYLEDMKPRQITVALRITLNIEVSKSTIVRWLNDVKGSLRNMLIAAPVPTSGYIGADEMFLRVGGTKMYQLDVVDLETKFILNAVVMENMTKSEWRKVLTECKFGKRGLIIKKLVKDGTTNFGDLMLTHGFRHIRTQTCLTHIKWTISKKVKNFLGMPKETKKPVPEDWQWLLRRFYAPIDAKNETDFEIKLLIASHTALKYRKDIRAPLVKTIELIQSKKDQIMAHFMDPKLDATNNLNESYHKKYKRYPSLKKQMKKKWGAQYRSDSTRFKHNLERFKTYIDEFWQKIDDFRSSCKENRGNMYNLGGWNHLLAEKEKLEKGFGEYLRIWNDFYGKI